MCQSGPPSRDDRRADDRVGRGLRDLVDNVPPVTSDEVRERARRQRNAGWWFTALRLRVT